MTTLPAREPLDIGRWLAWMAVTLAVVLTLLVMSSGGIDVTVRTGGDAGPIAPPATVSDVVPVHIQEGIIFGEIDPDATSSAEIMPVHLVEQSYFTE